VGTFSARVAALSLLAGVVTIAPASAGEARNESVKDAVVTAAVQVTTNPIRVRAHSSPQIAVNPKNGELVVVETDIQAARNDPEGRRGCRIHISADGGRTWFLGGNVMMEPYTECSRVVINGPYATMAFAKNGVLALAFTASDPKFANPHPPATIPRQVFFARSTDGGRSFQTTMVFQGPTEAAEAAGDLPANGRNGRAMVAIDPSDASRVYVSWAQGGSAEEKGKSLIAASTDAGRTFGEPVDVSDPRGGSQPRPAVAGDGAVHVLYLSGGFGVPRSEPPAPPVPRPIYHRKSTDGGMSWSDPVEVDPGAGSHRKWLLAADPNSTALYAVWYGNPTKDDVADLDYLDVFLRVSMDGGATWSEARTVNEGGASPTGVKRYDPNISITPNGRVDIAWYDFRNSPVPEGLVNYDFNGGGFQDVYYTSSFDNGRTFQRPDMRITDRIIDRNIGVWSNNYHSHTNVGVASTDDGVFFAWQDSRNGNADNNAEDVYFSSVVPASSATLNASLAAGSGDPGLPRWVVALTALAAGMGLAALAFLLLGRRQDGLSSGQE
jgi:hypothetical protein